MLIAYTISRYYTFIRAKNKIKLLRVLHIYKYKIYWIQYRRVYMWNVRVLKTVEMFVLTWVWSLVIIFSLIVYIIHIEIFAWYFSCSSSSSFYSFKNTSATRMCFYHFALHLLDRILLILQFILFSFLLFSLNYQSNRTHIFLFNYRNAMCMSMYILHFHFNIFFCFSLLCFICIARECVILYTI